MLKLKLLQNSDKLIKEASTFFDEKYANELQKAKPNTFSDSLVSRDMVSKLASEAFEVNDYLPAIDFEDEEFEDFTYSISHKD